MVDNIFDDIDISEVVQTDVPAVEAIPMLPTVERYDYVFTAWLKSGWSFADYSSMDDSIDLWNHLSILKKLSLINDFSPITVWRMKNNDTTQFAVDAHETYMTNEVIRTNDTKSNKNKISIGVSGRLDGVILFNIIFYLLEFVEQRDMRSVMIDVWTNCYKQPQSFRFGYSILDHFHKKQGSGPDIAAAFRSFLYLYHETITPQCISTQEYERLKTMFRIHNNQDVNIHFKSIFYHRIEVESYKTLSRQMEKGVIGRSITKERLLKMYDKKKYQFNHSVCIETYRPWETIDVSKWYLDALNDKRMAFIGDDGLIVRDVRLNSHRTRYSDEYCVAIYCGVRPVMFVTLDIREVFIVITSNNFDTIKKAMKLLFPGVDTSCLKGILNVED